MKNSCFYIFVVPKTHCKKKTFEKNRKQRKLCGYYLTIPLSLIKIAYLKSGTFFTGAPKGAIANALCKHR